MANSAFAAVQKASKSVGAVPNGWRSSIAKAADASVLLLFKLTLQRTKPGSVLVYGIVVGTLAITAMEPEARTGAKLS